MAHTGVTLRAAAEADRPAIVELTLDAYREYAAPLGEQWWADYSQNVADALGAAAPGELVVAERGGALVGSVLYFPPGTTRFGYPYLRLLAVTPAARGGGVASALLEECLRRARGAGATALLLHTGQVMEIPRQMYERRGFVRAPEYDFSPQADEGVLGYRISLTEAAGA